MREIAASAVVLYVMISFMAALMAHDERNRPGMFLLTMLIWPWLACIEGTPRMVPLKRWFRRGS